MQPRRKSVKGIGAIEVIEEACHLLRMAPAHILAIYYVGTLPFVIGLLYFWTDMVRSATAYAHCAEAALGLVALYVWMKSWQAVFADQLRTHLIGAEDPAWSFSRVWRLVAGQVILQPYSLLALPIALVTILPFGWVFAFYHNLSVTTGSGRDPMREACRRAWQQAWVWPAQNHLLICTMFFFGLFIFFNVVAILALTPYLLKILLGIETAFTLSGYHAIMNTTFLAGACGIAYLCTNPLVKAMYVVRCFYGGAIQTGEDLQVALARAAQKGSSSDVTS